MTVHLDGYIKRFINGDRTAFDEIYHRTRKSVYYVAFSVLRDGYLAEDVMQTTYMRVIKNIRSYVFGTNPAAWIVKIAKNEALNVKKTRARESLTDDFTDCPEHGSDEPYKYGELIDLARRNLDEDEFSVMMLVSVCGYKRREIGDMLDMPVSTVTWKYKNALGKMRVALKEGL